VRPNYGFCEIAEFLTGTSSRRNGFFCQTGRNADQRASLPLRIAGRMLDPIERRAGPFVHELCRSVLRRIARRWDRREIYQIPAGTLARFSATEGDRDYSAPLAFGVESVFDVLRAAGKSFDHVDFVQRNRIEGSDDQRAERLIARCSGELADLTVAYFGELDAAGHAHGPLSPGLRHSARTMDARVQRVVEAWSAAGADVVLLGDHGMLAVERSFDVQQSVLGAMDAHGWRRGRDYEIFVDSTLCRIWLLDDATSLGIEVMLEELFSGPEFALHGEELDEELARERNVPHADPRYGDVLFAAKPGVLFWPDYFNKAPVEGMHGYPTDVSGQKGVLLGIGPSFAPAQLEECELVDVAPTLTGVLGLPAPLQSEGRNLCKEAPRAQTYARSLTALSPGAEQ
jgi:hypothetical protein